MAVESRGKTMENAAASSLRQFRVPCPTPLTGEHHVALEIPLTVTSLAHECLTELQGSMNSALSSFPHSPSGWILELRFAYRAS